jgi:hypothetical protein
MSSSRLDSWLRGFLPLLCFAGIYCSWMENNIAWRAVQVCVFVMLGIQAVFRLRDSRPVRATWVLAPFAVIIAWAGLQVALGISVYAFATAGEALRWATYLAISFVSLQVFSEPHHVRRFTGIFIWASFATAIFSVIQYFTSGGKVFWTFGSTTYPKLGPFLSYDHYCSFIAIPLGMALYEGITNSSRRTWMLVAVAVLYASAVAGMSRAGVFLLTCEIIALLVLTKRRGMATGRSAAAVAGVLAAIAVPLLIGVGWERVYARYVNEMGSYRFRVDVALAAIDMIRDRPWTGFGLGTWVWVHPQFARIGFSGPAINAAHNDWLQWFGDGGVLMFAAMLAIFGFAARYAWIRPWMIGVPVVFLHSLIDFPMQGRFLPLVVFTVMGAGMASRSVRS